MVQKILCCCLYISAIRRRLTGNKNDIYIKWICAYRRNGKNTTAVYFSLKPIGVCHSHITEDNSFSVQDRESNRVLVRQIGEMLSIIVIQQKENEIGIIPYYVSEGNEEICLFGNKKSDFV